MTALQRRIRRLSLFVGVLLLIELLDELVFGAQQAAMPLIRDDLRLDYVQIGLFLAVPRLVAGLVEPFLGILGDTPLRRRVILAGGGAFAAGLVVLATSGSFGALLLGAIVLYPASGAFVSLSQAALMDHDPARHERNMARWTLVGSIGLVCGSLALGAAVALGWGWRPVLLALAGLSLVAVLGAARFRFPAGRPDDGGAPRGFRESARLALGALRRGEVIRWLALLEFSDLMLDGLLGYLALYFVDVAGWTREGAALAVAVWTGVGLAGDLALVFLLERVRGVAYLRVSAALQCALFPAFLLAEDPGLKLALLGVMGFFNAGWYAVLAGRLYSALPGQSGAVMVVGNVAGWFGSLLPLALGAVAQRLGLGAMMWFLLAAPLALVLGLPRRAGDLEDNPRSSQ